MNISNFEENSQAHNFEVTNNNTINQPNRREIQEAFHQRQREFMAHQNKKRETERKITRSSTRSLSSVLDTIICHLLFSSVYSIYFILRIPSVLFSILILIPITFLLKYYFYDEKQTQNLSRNLKMKEKLHALLNCLFYLTYCAMIDNTPILLYAIIIVGFIHLSWLLLMFYYWAKTSDIPFVSFFFIKNVSFFNLIFLLTVILFGFYRLELFGLNEKYVFLPIWILSIIFFMLWVILFSISLAEFYKLKVEKRSDLEMPESKYQII